MVLIEVSIQPNFHLIIPTDSDHIVLHQYYPIRLEKLLVASKRFVYEIERLFRWEVMEGGKAFLDFLCYNWKCSLGSASEGILERF